MTCKECLHNVGHSHIDEAGITVREEVLEHLKSCRGCHVTLEAALLQGTLLTADDKRKIERVMRVADALPLLAKMYSERN